VTRFRLDVLILNRELPAIISENFCQSVPKLQKFWELDFLGAWTIFLGIAWLATEMKLPPFIETGEIASVTVGLLV